MSTIEEVVGLVGGLAEVVKSQQHTTKEITAETQRQLQSLSKAVADLSLSVRPQNSSSSTLRLPQLILPEFTGREPLDRFIEQLTYILSSTSVSPKFWLNYLKQQCQKDARAFDIVCKFESEKAIQFSSTRTSDEFMTLYDQCLATLTAHRGVPKEQRIRELLATYYAMHQNPGESVSDFAHRFLETHHSLERLIPGIHRSSSPHTGDMELIHAFIMKLSPILSKELLSRDSPFSNLTAAIEAAKRYESVQHVLSPRDTPTPWTPESLLTATTQSASPVQQNLNSGQSGTKICWYFNKFHKAHCELPNNRCKFGFIHKCVQCSKSNCKKFLHNFHDSTRNKPSRGQIHVQPRGTFKHTSHDSRNSPPESRYSVSPRIHSNYAHINTDHDAFIVDTVKKVFNDSIVSLKQDLSASIAQEVEKRLPFSTSTHLPEATPQDPLYSMPAVSALTSSLALSTLRLSDKNILWTKVTSAGLSLPLPLDSCCSVSLVSQKHAAHVARQHPNLKFTKLEQHVPVSAAGPTSNLHAVGIMEVPIVWENGRSVIFTMLVVPNLTWPILFGQNHLRKTDARIYSKDLRVYFADSDMNFEISCYDSNPLSVFPSMQYQGSIPSASSANTTCLATSLPKSSRGIRQVLLRKG